MTSDEHTPRLFGTLTPGRAYIGRIGIHGIARSPSGLVAAVEDGEGRLYFPGGGVLSAEPLKAALEREALEECGWTIVAGQELARAFQLIDSRDEGSFLLDARFFRISILREASAPSEHRLVWLPAEICAQRVYRACDRWFAAYNLAAGS